MRKKILITDDSMFMRAMLKGILTVTKFEIFEASNGQEAVTLYERYTPDLVFMDITMPIMDGISATKIIHSKDPSARIVMCTAMKQKEMVVDAVKAGARDYIVKPFQADRVLQCVEKLLA